MVTFGIDPHKRTHTVAAVDGLGRQLGQMTVTKTTSEANLALLRWAERFGPDRQWAVEDCRRWSRRLEGDLLRAGERVRRVPPKLMAHARDVDRSYGKSDPIDSVAVARAALRHPDLLSLTSTARRGGCVCSSITVRTWSTSVRGGSTGCVNTSTRSTASGTHRNSAYGEC